MARYSTTDIEKDYLKNPQFIFYQIRACASIASKYGGKCVGTFVTNVVIPCQFGKSMVLKETDLEEINLWFTSTQSANMFVAEMGELLDRVYDFPNIIF